MPTDTVRRRVRFAPRLLSPLRSSADWYHRSITRGNFLLRIGPVRTEFAWALSIAEPRMYSDNCRLCRSESSQQ